MRAEVERLNAGASRITINAAAELRQSRPILVSFRDDRCHVRAHWCARVEATSGIGYAQATKRVVIPMTDFVSRHHPVGPECCLVARRDTISPADVRALCLSLLLTPHRTSTPRRPGNGSNPGRKLRST